jgi:hypothetical protein
LFQGLVTDKMNVALYIPQKEVSAWVTETDPKQARAWLAALPLADGGDSARDIYQALYTLNRLELAAHTRLELMALYRAPVATVSTVLHSQFSALGFPLAPGMRQLAEFIRQLQMEMAIGYKCAIQDLHGARLSWGKKHQLALASVRAMDYLGEVLLRSYQAYMPPPSGVWTEIHTLFRYAEEQDSLEQPVEISDDGGAGTTTISQRYRQILLLALCNPYQLPHNECNYVNAFLAAWADKALISDQLNIADPLGHFLINLTTDAPPAAMVQQQALKASPELRVLNTIEVARIVHGFIKRLEQGESVKLLNLGGEITDSAGREMLRRMIKFWGLTPQRKFARTKTRGHMSLCTGINALHFFSSGRKPFTPPLDEVRQEPTSAPATTRPAAGAEKTDTADTEVIDVALLASKAELPKWLSGTKLPTPESFPVDRWRLQDESARGLLLMREGEMAGSVRVGDVLGMQGGHDTSAWHIGVIRWIKSPEPRRVEMGVERLAPKVTPVAVRSADAATPTARYMQALLLPAMPVLQRPATLLIPRGLYDAGRDLELAVGGEAPRAVRVLKLLERTASFDLIVFAEVQARAEGH